MGDDLAYWGTGHWGNFKWGRLFLHTPIATEVVRSLVWTNISWGNISTSIVNRSTTTISVVPNRELPSGIKIMMWFEEGIKPHRYIDMGAEQTEDTVECHIFTRPTKNDGTTIGSYKRDKNHLVEEVQRVIRGNRTNASGFEFIYVDNVVPLDIANDPSINPPYLESLVRVRCRKYREEIT